MAFDFPASPAIDTIFEDTQSGAAYKWVGTKWWRTKSAVNPEPKPPPPIISAMVPSSVVVGDPSPVTVAVRGGPYTAASVVLIDGTLAADAKSTTFVSATELRFPYPIPNAATTSTITVRNADGQVSAGKPLTVTLVPLALTSLTPSMFAVGTTSPATIAVAGTAFSSTSVVTVDSAQVPTAFVSDTALNFSYTIPSGPATAQVKVLSGGKTSNAKTIQTINAPIANSLAPPNANSALTAGQDVRITGSNFLGGLTEVYENGSVKASQVETVSVVRYTSMVSDGGSGARSVTVKSGSIASPSSPLTFTWF